MVLDMQRHALRLGDESLRLRELLFRGSDQVGELLPEDSGFRAVAVALDAQHLDLVQGESSDGVIGMARGTFRQPRLAQGVMMHPFPKGLPGLDVTGAADLVDVTDSGWGRTVRAVAARTVRRGGVAF